MAAPSTPPPQPTSVRRVTLPLYQMSCAHPSSFHFSVIACPPSGSHTGHSRPNGRRCKPGSFDLENDHFRPQASSTANAGRGRKSSHHTPMPDGTTRHYQSSPLPDLGELLFPLSNAIRHQVSTALFLLMHCNSHGRMTARGLSRSAQSGEQYRARGRHQHGIIRWLLHPCAVTKKQKAATGFRRALRSGPERIMAPPPGWHLATCREILPFCRRHSQPISYASASSTPSPAR